MIERCEDLWLVTNCDARCITTNGTIKADGRAVMGRGVALQACRIYQALRKIQGQALQAHGNVPTILLPAVTPQLVSFPVKRHWYDWADLDLIEQSARLLVALTDREGWRRVVLPRPGCYNGHRDWTREVEPILRPVLDDRFLVVHR
jgi:hypothetical protein